MKHSFRPTLEALEDRLCLSTETLTSNITFLPYVHATGPQVTVAGTLKDNNGNPLGGHTIDLSGPFTWNGHQNIGDATTDASGNWTITINPTAMNGTVRSFDDNSNSNISGVTLWAGTPVISNFTATALGLRQWELTGNVNSSSPWQGEVVSFSGISAVNGVTCGVPTGGAFSKYINVLSGGGGIVGAIVTDWYGNTSNEVYTDITA
jgi:hypothetical protein